MEKSFIDPLKCRLNKISETWEDSTGKCVLYVMSRDQRVHDNHALLAAQKHALKLGLPLAVVFVLHKVPATRAREHYDFMLDGLTELESALAKLDIPFVALIGKPSEKLPNVFHHYQPAVVYFDFNPLRGPKQLIDAMAKLVPVICVDTHNIVPVWLASDRQEVGARTLRPKIHKYLTGLLVLPETVQKHPVAWPGGNIFPLAHVRQLFQETLNTIPYNNTKIAYKSGEAAAHKAMDDFLHNRLSGYAQNRNNPTTDGLSGMSLYLHFGQISSLRIIHEAQRLMFKHPTLQPDFDVLAEEMVVRKELSDNFCYYNDSYDSFAGAPTWARATLEKHKIDPREFVYTPKQFEHAATHDEAWNAAQMQLRKTGKIHGYMRMYWAKKVLEWSATPQEAMNTLVYLNDFYSIDGGDPNGYVGILWSIAGLHDRPWRERSVYGTVRSMVYSGLKRKFDIGKYIKQNS